MMKNNLVNEISNKTRVEIIDLPTPKLLGVRLIKRAEGYKIPQIICTAAKVEFDGIQVEGFGEARSKQVSVAKSISEAYERFAFFYSKRLGIKSQSSNGWACHTSIEKAIESAVLELVERDVAVKTWRNLSSYVNIPQSFWPEPLIKWELMNQKHNLEFGTLKVLLSHGTNGACVNVFLLNKQGNFVSGHASGLNLNEAILSAAQECFRAAHLALRFEFFSEVQRLHSGKVENEKPFEPGVHALAYAYSKTLPKEIIFENTDSQKILEIWNAHQEQIQKHINTADNTIFIVHDRFAVKSSIEGIDEMKWGRSLSLYRNNLPHNVG